MPSIVLYLYASGRRINTALGREHPPGFPRKKLGDVVLRSLLLLGNCLERLLHSWCIVQLVHEYAWDDDSIVKFP